MGRQRKYSRAAWSRAGDDCFHIFGIACVTTGIFEFGGGQEAGAYAIYDLLL